MKATLFTRLGSIAVALAIAASTYIPAARASRSHSPVTVTIWTAYNRAQAAAFNTLISEFEAKYPSIKVDMVSSPNYGALLQKEQSAVFAGNPPTIAQAYEEWTQQFVKSHAVQDLTPYIKGKDGLTKKDIADFFPKVWQDGLLGKTRYMMPFSKSDIVLYFDGPMLRKYGIKSPPKTWAELAKDAKKLTINDNGHLSQWGMTFQVDTSPWYAWEYEWGNTVLNKHGKAAFGNKNGARPVAFFANLVKNKSMVVAQSANFQDQADFDAGKTAFDIGSIAGLSFFLAGAKPGVGVGVAPFPAGPKARATEFYGAPFVMFNKAATDEKKAGWQFLKWITQAKQSMYWSEQSGYIPIRKSELKLMRKYYLQHPQLRAAYQELGYALIEPSHLGWTKARTDIANALQAALTGSKSPMDAMREAADQVNNDLTQQ